MLRRVMMAGAHVAPKWRVPITVGVQSAAMSDFPVLIDLVGLPSTSWARLKEDGGDIRAVSDSGASLAIDLVQIDVAGKKGVAAVKTPLSNTAATTFFLEYGDHTFNRLAPAAANGRDSVWAGYEAVLAPAGGICDRTGKHPSPTIAAVAQARSTFVQTAITRTPGRHVGWHALLRD